MNADQLYERLIAAADKARIFAGELIELAQLVRASETEKPNRLTRAERRTNQLESRRATFYRMARRAGLAGQEIDKRWQEIESIDRAVPK